MVPEAPRKVYTSGPYSSLGAERRAQKGERITGQKARVIARNLDGVTRYSVNGDSPEVPGWSGEMTPEASK